MSPSPSIISLFGALELEPLAWALLHFIWQGALIGILVAVSLRLMRSASSQARYSVVLLGLALMAASPLVTAWYLTTEASPAPAGTIVASDLAAVASPQAETVISVAPVIDQARQGLEPHLGWLLGIWFLGVMALAFRHAGGLWRVRGLIHRAQPARHGRDAIMRMGERLGLRRIVPLLESDEVDSPLVIGFLRPVVLVPPAAFFGLAPQQLEAILLHELAHIRRYDYWVNLLQVALETLLFYHPAIWWLSNQARELREHCCDDVAVGMLGEPLLYAQALAAIEEMRPQPPVFALGASGGSLLRRIKRLVATETAPSSYRRSAGQSLATTVIAAILAVGIAAAGSLLTGGDSVTAAPADGGAALGDSATSEEYDDAGDWVGEDAAVLEAAAAGTPWSGLGKARFEQLARWGFEAEAFRALSQAGINLEASDLEELARHGFDVEDLAELKRHGIELDGSSLREMLRHGFDSEDISEWRRAGFDELTVAEMLDLARHGLDGEDAAEFVAAGYARISKEQLVLLARHGIDGEDVVEYTSAGLTDLSVEQLASLARHGVDGEEVAAWRRAGFSGIALQEITSLARHGVDAEDAEDWKRAGFADLSTDDLMRLSRHGLDGEEAAELQQAGLGTLTVGEIESLARQGVDGDDVAELREAGFVGLSVEQVLELARHGVDGDDIADLRAAGLPDLTFAQALDLARHGIDEDEIEDARRAGKAVDFDSLMSMARSGELWHLDNDNDDED